MPQRIGHKEAQKAQNDSASCLCLLCLFVADLCSDPAVGAIQSFLQRNRRLPIQDLAQASIVAVAAPDSLWLGYIVTLRDLLTGDRRDYAPASR